MQNNPNLGFHIHNLNRLTFYFLLDIDRFRLRMYLPFWQVFSSCYVIREKGERVFVLREGRNGGGMGREAFDLNGIGLLYSIS